MKCKNCDAPSVHNGYCRAHWAEYQRKLRQRGKYKPYQGDWNEVKAEALDEGMKVWLLGLMGHSDLTTYCTTNFDDWAYMIREVSREWAKGKLNPPEKT